MSRTINKVELLGRVGVDPEMQYTPGGTAVTKLRLATDRYRKDAEPETDWHNIVVWSNTAEAVNQYVAKGDRIYVAGRLVQNSWEGDDGQRRHRTEVHASEVVFLDNRNGNGNGGDGQAEDALPLLARRLTTEQRRPLQPGATPRGRFHSTGSGPALGSDQYRRKVTAMSITMWLALGERGISSEAIALTALGVHPIGHDASWPHDPGDLRRCRLLLEEAPETRENGLLVLGETVSEVGRLGERLGPPVGDIALRNRRDPPARRLSAQDVGIDDGGVGLGRQGLSDSSGSLREPTTAQRRLPEGATTGPLPTYKGRPRFCSSQYTRRPT